MLNFVKKLLKFLTSLARQVIEILIIFFIVSIIGFKVCKPVEFKFVILTPLYFKNLVEFLKKPIFELMSS